MSDDLYVRMGKSEWDRYDRLSTAISFQAGLALAGGTAIAYFAKELPRLTYSFRAALFVFFGLGAVLSWMLQTFFLFRAWYNYQYAYIPSPEKLEQRRRLVMACFISRGIPEKEALRETQADFQEQIRNVERLAATINRGNNNAKSANIHRARGAFGCTLLGLVLTFSSSLVLLSRKDSSVPVTVNDVVKVRIMADQPNPGAQDPAPPADPQPAPPEPSPDEVPMPPPLEPELLREGEIRSDGQSTNTNAD